MSFMPEKRQCWKCGKWYSFNPDVNKVSCPYCAKKMEKEIKKGKSMMGMDLGPRIQLIPEKEEK